METDTGSTFSPSNSEVKSKSHVKIVVIAVAVIAIVVGAFLVGFLALKPQDQKVWLFEGAYATYEGTTSVIFVNFSFTIRLEVVDFNSTHAQLLMYASIDSSLSEPEESQNTTWIDLSDDEFVIEDATLVSSYEGFVYFEGLGTRNCVVYEYETDGPTVTVYVDKEIGWPLKLNVSMTGEDSLSLDLDITLVETNIPGLK